MALCRTAVESVVDPPSCCTRKGQEGLSSSEQCSQDIVDGKVSPCYKTGEDEWRSGSLDTTTLGVVSLDKQQWPLVEKPGPPKMPRTLSLSLLSQHPLKFRFLPARPFSCKKSPPCCAWWQMCSLPQHWWDSNPPADARMCFHVHRVTELPCKPGFLEPSGSWKVA